jgi:hypothetical protein
VAFESVSQCKSLLQYHADIVVSHTNAEPAVIQTLNRPRHLSAETFFDCVAITLSETEFDISSILAQREIQAMFDSVAGFFGM